MLVQQVNWEAGEVLLFSVLWGLERAWSQVGSACFHILAVALPS